MKYRILFVSDIFYPHPGGISEHIHHLSAHLRKRGHETFILTANFPDGVKYVDPPYVIRVGRSFKVPVNKSIGSITLSPRIHKVVKDIVQKGNYHFIHIHGPIAPVLPMLALKYSRSINVATFHAAHDKNLLYRLFKNYLEQYFQRLHGRIAVSEVAKRSIEKYFPGEYKIIPNGVDIHRFNPHNPPMEWVKNLPGKKVLFVGRLEPRKGLKFLLLAIPEIVKYIPDARFIVVGDGPLRKFYEQFIRDEHRDRVHFAGKVPYDDLPRYYTSADVFVSPATGNESFGIVLLEAMASRIPVVASDIEGYKQVIRDGVNGLLFHREDHLDLADKVVRVLSNPPLAKKLAETGYRNAVEKYSWEVVSRQVEEYYDELFEKFAPRVFGVAMER